MRMIVGIVSGPFGEREHADLSRYLTWLRPGDSQRVGRSGYKADMVIPSDQRMSSGHFVVSCEEDGCYVSDMESTNGTFVNGQRIGQLTRLHDGDEIVAGSTTFNVQIIAPGRRSTSLEIDREAAARAADAAAADAVPVTANLGPQFALELVSGPGVSNLTDTGTLHQGWLPAEAMLTVGSSAQEADFVVEGDESVASAHLTLHQQGAVIHLAVGQDCPAVKINNITVREAELSGGERITIGQTVLLLRSIQRHTAPSQVPPKDSTAQPALDEDIARHINALSSGHRDRVAEALQWFNEAIPADGLRDKVCQKIATFTRSSDQTLRHLAATSYARWTTAKGQVILLQLLSNNDLVVLQAAVEGLLRIGDLKSAEAIAGVLKDSSRRPAAIAAVESQKAGAENVGLRLLLHDDDQVQIEACRILQSIGGKQSRVALQAKLQRLTSGDHEAVRCAAEEALQAVRSRR